MLSTDANRRSVAIALVYQSEALNAHVREAMTELGAKVVYESSVLAYRPKELAGSGAQVVIINLDPSSDDDLSGIDDLLIDDGRRVVFNDGEVTARLSGWDLARWARHLAAKVLGEQVGLPPAPVGSEAIPQAGLQRADLSTPDRPKTLEPTTPIGSVDEAEFAADEMTRALADFSMEQAAQSNQKAAQDDLAATLAGLGLGDFDLAAPAAPEPAAKINESKSIFEELGLALDEPVAPSPAAKASAAPPAVEEENPFAGLDINFDAFDDAPSAREEPQGLDALLASLPKETKTDKPERQDRSNAPTLELPVPPALAGKKPAAEPTANPFAGLSLELSPLDGSPAPAVTNPSPAPSRPSLAERDFSAALASLSLAPLEDAPSSATAAPIAAPAAAPSAAPIAKDRGALDLGGLSSLSLEPIEQEVDNIFTAAAKNRASVASSDGDAAAGAPPALPPSLPPDLPDLDDDNPFADLDLNFDALNDGDLPKVARDTVGDGPSEDDFLREFGALGSLATPGAGAIEHVVVLGASIGGPDAVREFLSAVQANERTVFVLAQHMGADFVELMAQQLQRATRMHVLMPSNGQTAKAGDILIVPVAERLLLEPSGEVRLVTPDQASPYSPSIDQVLFDVADRFGERAMAIIFSGMAHDAIEGAKHLASKGGRIWVQDPSTCVVSSMIDGAIEAGIVSYIGSPPDLAAQFNREFK